MQILSNNMLSREKVIFITNSYIKDGWQKRTHYGKSGMETILEREESLGKLSKRIDFIKISNLDLTEEIVIRDVESEYIGIDVILNYLKKYMSKGYTIHQSMEQCLVEGIIDRTDIFNFEKCYDISNLLVN